MHSTPRLVSDVMTRTVVALGSTVTFKDIVKAMRRRQISALPVVDAGHRVVGVVSEADLLPKEEFRAHDPDADVRLRRPEALARAQARTASELMTAPAVTVGADVSLARAARIMARHQVKHLPVVDDAGVLTGIVSRTDLLKVFLRTDADLAEEVRREVVGPLFPDPLEPVRVDVRDGVVTLTGRVRDTGLVPIAVRLTRAVEGVVDVESALTGPPWRPLLDPDLVEEP
ncbi:CBS domain protein [Streptomyces sp. TLI_55]|uniref:CBS domain-containing protein n=1 Tax=Streptomyces sp. TLI_55 TaxID=1938861 RepID=UPI000BCB571E|nr:CBS domain-containing protein [Streptomyces sp. TLI_55]SNX56046.1 CBS domain protein [Streptomyces sp. TLI_55]